MAPLHDPSNHPQRSLPAGSPSQPRLPQITGLSTAFPMEMEGDRANRTSPHRIGEDRKPRRHPSGH